MAQKLAKHRKDPYPSAKPKKEYKL